MHVIVVTSCLLSGRAYKKSSQPVVVSLVFTIVIVVYKLYLDILNFSG